MNTNLKNPEPMSEDQLEYIKKQINLTYLFLISHTQHDPKVVEVMKLSALANASDEVKIYDLVGEDGGKIRQLYWPSNNKAAIFRHRTFL